MSSSSGGPATTYWVGNAQTVAQVDTLTVTAVANGGILSAQISDKVISYTCTGSDTTATAAAAWQALLAGTNLPPEFGEVTFTQVGAVITCTAATPGSPFTLSTSGTGGATVSQVHTTANGSPNDNNNANNWIRNGVYSVPQAGDDVIISDSSVSILWNLDAFKNLNFNSVNRYNTFTGQIGLPENNPNGYYEYRPTYWQFAGVTTQVQIGLGPGSGVTTLERYNSGAFSCVWNVIGATAVRILGTSPASTFMVNGATVDIATLPTETANTQGGVTVVNGGTINLGLGVTCGPLSVQSSSVAFCNCVPSSITANAGTVTMNTTGGTCPSVYGTNGSTFTWNSSTNITNFQAYGASVIDKSVDARPIVITNSTVDGTGSPHFNDPWNAISFTFATTVTGVIASGPFVVGPNRTVKVT